MAIFRLLAIAAVFAAGLGMPAHACDSNYPWTCQPVRSIDPPETTEPSKPAAKPLSTKRSAQAKRNARKSAARQWAVRARRAKIAAASAAAARAAAAEARKSAQSEPTRKASAKPGEAGPAITPARVAEDGNDRNTGFATMWAERSTAEPAAASAADPARIMEPATGSAPLNPVTVALQNEVTAIDLAAAEPVAASNSSWLRGLFLAFGGLIAAGSALRLFL
jgi:hypothetical protein